MGGQRFFALDVLRVVLTCAICVLHAISAFSFHQSNDEASALLGTDLPNNGARLSALRSISSIGFTLVDLFFALTSIMITDKLLRTWSAPAPPTWSDLVSTYYGRMVGTCLPLFIVMGLYVIGFRDGIYPEATNRAENALVLHRMSSNHSVELLEGKVTPGGVLTTLKDPGLHGWPYLLLHISNIGVPGGMLEHSWSLSIQVQWYVWTPLLPYAIYAGRWLARKVCCACRRTGAGSDAPLRLEFTPAMLLWTCGIGVLACTVVRFVAHRHLTKFEGIFALFIHFYWYSNTLARLTPLLVAGAGGALVSADLPFAQRWRTWLLKGTPPIDGEDKRSDDNVAATWLRRRNVVAIAMVLNFVATLLLNAFWRDIAKKDDESSRALHHELMYVLYRPGGVLCAMAYTWVILTLMFNVRWWPIGREAATDGADSPVDVDTPAADVAPMAATLPAGLRKRSKPAAAVVEPAVPAAAPSSENEVPTKAAPRHHARTPLCNRLVAALVPITYSVYLVNSVVYMQMYGWPQRLHPCPTLLKQGTLEVVEPLLNRYSLLLPSLHDPTREPTQWDASLLKLETAVHATEVAVTGALTTVAQTLRGPDDLYCAPDARGVVACRGICFSGEVVDVDNLEDASCLSTRNCTSSRFNRFEERLRIPSFVWLQYLHYGAICIGVTWVMAILLFYCVELPLGLVLFSKPVARVLQYPVLAYVVVCLLASIPAHVVSMTTIMQAAKATAQLNALLHQHFA